MGIRGIEDYTMREFTFLEDDEERRYESKFTDIDCDFFNDFTGSDSKLESE